MDYGHDDEKMTRELKEDEWMDLDVLFSHCQSANRLHLSGVTVFSSKSMADPRDHFLVTG
jgi:hypothetical protein